VVNASRPVLDLWLRRGARVGTLCALVAVSSAFRCPGPDPQGAEQGGGGSGGEGGSTSTQSTSTTQSTTSSSSGETSTGGGGLGGFGGEGGAGGGCDPGAVSSDPDNCGACGRPCSQSGAMQVACVGGVCAPACMSGFVDFNSPAAPVADDGCETQGRRTFVTSQPVIANFGSAILGDAVCQAFADAALLGGVWMSWTADDATTPELRFVQSGVPYFLVDQTMVAADWADLTDGTLMAGIALDELGASKFGAEVWTGIDFMGSPGATCFDWTSASDADVGTVGFAGGVNVDAGSVYLQFCNRDNVRLYCFEQ